MKLVGLTINNFQSIGSCPLLKLDGQGLVLIEGENRDDQTADSNGAGKSTIFDAITWSLFGTTVRGRDGDEIVNERKPKDCMVGLSLLDDKGTVYSINRYRKHTEHKNKLIVTGGKRDLSALDPEATQAFIEELIGMDYETFKNAALFGQGVVKHFPAMTDKEQKVIMEKLVGVEVVRKAHEEAKESLATVEEKLEALQQIVGTAALDEVRKEITDLKEERSTFDDERRRKLSVLEDEIAGLKANAPDVKAAEEAYSTAKAACDEAQRTEDSARHAERDAEKGYAEARAEMRASAARLEKLGARVKASIGKTRGECDSCGAEITPQSAARHTDELQRQHTAFKVEHAKLERTANEWGKKVTEAEAKLAAARKEHRAAEEEIEKARNALNVAKNGRQRIEDKRREIDRVKGERWTGGERLAKKEEKLKDLTEKVRAAAKEIKTWEEKKHHMEFVATMFSDKGVEGAPPLKGLIFESVTPFLNKHAAHYAKYLTAGNISVEFSAQSVLKSGAVRDRFGVTAVNRNGAGAYGGQSGGEKRKVDICAALALQRLGAARSRAQLNIAFFDEVFESLDETACDAVMELLTAEAKRYSSLFVITHMEGLKAFFPRSWRVVKEKGISRIVA